MRRHPDLVLVLGQFDELIRRDHFDWASAPNCVQHDLARPAPSLGPYGHCYLRS